MNYEPYLCDSEEEARSRTEELIPNRKWPCYFFKSDTTGEKDYEEFYTTSENVDLGRFNYIGVIKRDEKIDRSKVEKFVSFAKSAKKRKDLIKSDYVEALEDLVPTLRHLETGKNLDGKM